jgi:integrase
VVHRSIHRSGSLLRVLGLLESEEKVVAKKTNKLTDKSRMADLLDYYLDSHAFLKLSRPAQKDYESCTKVIRASLGSVRLRDITVPKAEGAYEEWLKRGTYRANKIAAIMSIILNKAIGMGLRILNPVPHMDRETNPERKVLWEPDQVYAFLDTAYSDIKWRSIGLIVQMAYEWGQRIGDMRLLTWDCIDLDKKRCDITQSKRGAEVHLPISDPLMHVLKQQHDTFSFQPYVAPQIKPSDGAYKPYRKDNLFSYVNDIKQAAGLPDELTAMDMRRSAITEMVEAGVDITQIKQVSGHSNINSLTPYIKHTYTGASEALAQRSAYKEKQ